MLDILVEQSVTMLGLRLSTIEDNPSEEDDTLILTSAITIVCIIIEHRLKCNKSHAGVLSRGLLLRPNVAEKSCKSYYDLIVDHFPEKQRFFQSSFQIAYL